MNKELDVEDTLEEVKKVLDKIKLSNDLLIDWCWEEFGLSIGTPDTN